MSWDKEVIAAEQKCERSLLIDLTGEGDLKTKHKERSPVNLAIVIDCSGSMEGAPIDLVLADLNFTENLIIAKDYIGNAYLPEWNFNGIGDLIPGRGYSIKVTTNDVVHFLSNTEDY